MLVNYYLFREEIVPEYCRIRSLSEEALMETLFRCPGPSKPLSEMEHMRDFRSLKDSLFMKTAAVAANSGMEVMTSAKEAPAVATEPVLEQESDENLYVLEERAR